MDRNLAIISQLAKLNQKSFYEHNLEKMGIHYDERQDLLRKGLLKREKEFNIQYSEDIYFLSDSAYMLITAKETEVTSKDTRKLTYALLIGTVILIILAIIFKFIWP